MLNNLYVSQFQYTDGRSLGKVGFKATSRISSTKLLFSHLCSGFACGFFLYGCLTDIFYTLCLVTPVSTYPSSTSYLYLSSMWSPRKYQANDADLKLK